MGDLGAIDGKVFFLLQSFWLHDVRFKFSKLDPFRAVKTAKKPGL